LVKLKKKTTKDDSDMEVTSKKINVNLAEKHMKIFDELF